MYLKVLLVCMTSLIIQGESSWSGYYGPFGPGGPYGIGGPYGPGGPYGIGSPYRPGGSPAIGASYGPGGPYGIGGPYGPGGPYGIGGPYGPGGPYGIGGQYGPAIPKPFLPYKPWSSTEPTKPSEVATRKRRAADAKASFGFGPFVPFYGYHQQFLSSKFNYLSQSMYLRSLYIGTVATLNNDLKLARDGLVNKSDVFVASIENASSDPALKDRDISACTANAKTAVSDINLKIESLDIDLGESEQAQQIKKNISLLNAQMGTYGKSFGLCKFQFTSFTTQAADMQQCLQDQQEAANIQLENLTNSVTENIETLRINTTETINNTVKEVEDSIILAKSNFDVCI